MNPSAWVNLAEQYQNDQTGALGTSREELREALLGAGTEFDLPMVPLPPLVERPLEVP